jgi:hypothetical protein
VRATFGWLAAIGVVALVTMLPAAEASKESEARIVREVGHELRSLSNYGLRCHPIGSGNAARIENSGGEGGEVD